jgi:hypothetical protein
MKEYFSKVGSFAKWLTAATAITGFLISLGNINNITTDVFEEYNVNSSNSNVDSSLLSLGIFKRFVKNPGVLFFFVVSFISYILKNYIPVNSFTINIISIFQFSLVWVLLFTCYSIMVLYVANSITPTNDGIIRELKLPVYTPNFIKRHLNLINVLVYENKQKAVDTQIRVVFMFVLLLLLIIIMFSILLYFK